MFVCIETLNIDSNLVVHYLVCLPQSKLKSMPLISPIIFDELCWPILIVRHPEQQVDKHFTLEYLAKLQTYFERNEKIVLVFDVRVSKPPTAEHRFIVAEWVKKNTSLIRPNCLGTAYVMSGVIQQLALMSFLKFLDTTAIIDPVKVFTNMNKAIIWAKSQFGNFE